MTALERAVLRFLGVWAVVAGIGLLEDVAYAAGVGDAARVLDDTLAAYGLDEDLADDELEPADVSDVVTAHAECCGVPAC